MYSPESFMDIYRRMSERFGPLSWWPAETPFEVCVGAILTQNTAWTNVEKAIIALKQATIMTPAAMRDVEPEQLAQLIRPAGYFNVKSTRLKAFVSWLFLHHQGSLEQMFSGDWLTLRAELIQVRGIGPETADSILLYAGNKPTFVVDAYTRRLFHRLGLLPENAGYDETRALFMAHLPADVQLFNEYHALIVRQCKQFCRKKPLCNGCPLFDGCLFAMTAV
ncbi:MAG: endonuclease III domain-containing protein [Verrucomicrobia bacterium]|nr:endonuclease III domain-containing protein [Deltaproteobacteria bacterium]